MVSNEESVQYMFGQIVIPQRYHKEIARQVGIALVRATGHAATKRRRSILFTPPGLGHGQVSENREIFPCLSTQASGREIWVCERVEILPVLYCGALHGNVCLFSSHTGEGYKTLDHSA